MVWQLRWLVVLHMNFDVFSFEYSRNGRVNEWMSVFNPSVDHHDQERSTVPLAHCTPNHLPLLPPIYACKRYGMPSSQSHESTNNLHTPTSHCHTLNPHSFIPLPTPSPLAPESPPALNPPNGPSIIHLIYISPLKHQMRPSRLHLAKEGRVRGAGTRE